MNNHRLRELWDNGIKQVLGVILIVLGIIGLFLPVLQGVAMILLGLALLGSKYAKCKLRQMHAHIKAWWGKRRAR